MKPCSLYIVTRRETGDSYVGVAVNTKKRWSRHKWEALRNGCDTYFARALRVYGVEAFDWEILCTLDSEELARVAEITAITCGLGHYNLTPGGDGNTHPSREVRAKMSAAQQKRKTRSPETKARMSAAQKGHTVSPETRAKMSALYKGVKRGPPSAEHRANLSAALKGRKKSPAHAAAISTAKRGTVRSLEARQKTSDSLRVTWALRKARELKKRREISHGPSDEKR